MTEYRRADEVAHLASEIIEQHHDHLLGVRIEYVWRDIAADKGGRAVLGKARKIGGLNAFLARQDVDSNDCEDFFVIEIAQDTWAGMDNAQRRALVDHELCHCGFDDKARLTIRCHEVEEFGAVLRRHGAWKGDLAEFIEIGKGIHRLRLAEPEPEREPDYAMH